MDLFKSMQRGKKEGPFKWGPDQNQVFYKLKELFISTPILQHYKPTVKIHIEINISEFSIADILSQLLTVNTSWTK